jgi:hypothetical protein
LIAHLVEDLGELDVGFGATSSETSAPASGLMPTANDVVQFDI